jgi:transcription termination/antitermination protein NusG
VAARRRPRVSIHYNKELEIARVTIEPESSNLSGDVPGETPAEAAASPSSPAASPEMSAADTIADRAEASLSEPAPEVEDEIEEEPEADVPFAEPLEFIDESAGDSDLKYEWFILKVQVNREDSIKDALMRKVKMEGLDRFFKEVVVPTEDVAEFTKTGKRRVVKRKIYPGYILVNMSVNDETWFIVRETPGIGDFTGAGGKPSPMQPKDVERILRSSKAIEDEGAQIKTAIPFKMGDKVRVKEGNFQNFEGEIGSIDEAHGRVTVMITIFGRATPVEMEHWNIEKL